MSIQNAGKTIRDARMRAGLTQEQLSYGICSVLSLSRIENNTAGISPVTFQTLMTRAGSPSEIYPMFKDRTDFDCFYCLKRASVLLNSWKLQETYDELEKIEKWNWGNNRFYYQEWLYLHAHLQQRSEFENHDELYTLLCQALRLTSPDLDLVNFKHAYLSIVEIALLTAIAQELLALDQAELCQTVCQQLSDYLSNSTITYREKDCLMAELAIVYGYYLLKMERYAELLSCADFHRHKMVERSEDGPLLSLTFLTALGYYYTGDKKKAYSYFKAVFFSALSIDSYYATSCRNYVISHALFTLDEYLAKQPDVKKTVFPVKKATDTTSFSDGTYDFFSSDLLTIGKLIRELRTEQHLQQTVLCQGLCSKSKLSKIESETLQPDIFLTEALLQRLGISDRIFTFYGSRHHAELYELRCKLIRDEHFSIEEKMTNIQQFKELISPNDILPEQFYQYSIAMLENDPYTSIQMLYNALYLTLPDFNILYLRNYHLSWNELTILNGIASKYRYTDTPFIGTQILQKLLEYYQIHKPDILLKRNTCTVTFCIISRSLYIQKRFFELSTLLTTENMPLLQLRLGLYSAFLFYYAQALAECSQFIPATQYAVYSCEIDNLFELSNNSDVLRMYFLEDFSIIVP